MESASKWNSFITALAIFFAFALQVLVTLEIGNTHIRIASADFLLPLVLVGLLIAFKAKGMKFVLWGFPRVWPWLIVLSLWMTFALVNGLFFTGELQTWGFVNKYVGWYVLLLFFIFGGLVGNLLSERSQAIFFSVLFLTAVSIALIDIVPYLQTMRGLGVYFRAQGYAGNPNAYGFLLVLITVILFIRKADANIVSKRFDNFGLGLLLAMIVFSGSRSAWLALLFSVVTLGVVNRVRLKMFLFPVVVACLLTISFHFVQPIEKFVYCQTGWTFGVEPTGNVCETVRGSVHGKSVVSPYIARANMVNDGGVNHRLQIMESAHELWLDYPVLGIGLGGFLWSERLANRDTAIHSTAQWLLVEAGLVGLILFVAFFLDLLWYLWKGRAAASGIGSLMGLIVIAGFAGASIGMEAMYQRHIWFFLGWALALSCQPKPTQTDPKQNPVGALN